MAKANGIKVVLSSVTPVCDCVRNVTAGRPPERITALNTWLREYAHKNGHVYLDYFSAMIDSKGLLRSELTGDGLHFNPAGYAIMGPLAEKAIADALKK
jgi:lysophospholipase L1-like esterase